MPATIPITVIILSHNEAINLPRCLAALSNCADVVVVDDGSTDESRKIALEFGARVVEHPFTSFADQRNWAMEAAACRCAWTLHLDADEVMTPVALEEIRTRLASLPEHHVGFIARKIMLDDRWLRHSANYPVYVPRLVHRNGPRFIMRGHGEIIDAPPSSSVWLNEPMLHYAFSKGWADWHEKHRRYAEAEARRFVAGGIEFVPANLWSSDPVTRRHALRALSFTLPGRPLWRFLYLYIVSLGFLDGGPGFRFSRAMARYENMIDESLRQLRKIG